MTGKPTVGQTGWGTQLNDFLDYLDGLASSSLRTTALFGARKVAFCGDSITAGTGASTTSLRYSTQSTRVAGTARAFELVNGGVAGDRSDQLLARMATILGNNPDHAHIQIGTNDAGQSVSLATFQTNILAIVAACRAAGVTVSMGLVPPRGSAAASSIHNLVAQYNLWLQSYCPRNGIALGDTYAALVDPTTGYLAAANDTGDGTHPSNAGHLAMARVVGPLIMSQHLATPWPVKTVSPIGLLSNPLMNGSTGWSDQGGTGTATISTQASSTGDQLGAGGWLTYRINNSAGGSTVFRQVAATLDNTKYSAGDVMLLCAKMNHSDTTLASSAKLQVTNGGTAFTIPFDTSSSVNNPGPIMSTFTIPGSPTTIRLGMVLTAGIGVDVTAFLGATQVYNLTTGGLVGIA